MFDLIPFGRLNRNSVYYDPFREFDELEKRFFPRSASLFKTDIKEIENAYVLEAELPGFAKEDISAEVKDNRLIIKAEHKSEKEEKDEKSNYIRRERSWGAYSREFDLSGIDADAIKASYENGVLELTLPKIAVKKEEAKKLEISGK